MINHMSTYTELSMQPLQKTVHNKPQSFTGTMPLKYFPNRKGKYVVCWLIRLEVWIQTPGQK